MNKLLWLITLPLSFIVLGVLVSIAGIWQFALFFFILAIFFVILSSLSLIISFLEWIGSLKPASEKSSSEE